MGRCFRNMDLAHLLYFHWGLKKISCKTCLLFGGFFRDILLCLDATGGWRGFWKILCMKNK